MRRLPIMLLALLLVSQAWAYPPRGGSRRDALTELPDCTATTGSCPSDKYTCVDSSSHIYRCCISCSPSGWTDLTAVAGITGPSSSTDNALVRFDGTGGVTLQDYTSGAPTASDTGTVTTTALVSSALTLTGFACNAYNNSGCLTTNASGVVACSDDDGGAGSSVWTTDANVIHPTVNTDTVTVGGTGALAKIAADGDADIVQLLAQGHSTQNADIFVVETSGTTDVFTVSPTAMTMTGTASISAGATIATYLDIPSGSDGSSPTVDAAGEIAIDTNDDQLVFYGTAKRVLAYETLKCAVIEDLATGDTNFEIMMARDQVTITSVACYCKGTCTTAANISLEDRTGNAMTHTTPTCATGSDHATFQTVSDGGSQHNTLVTGEGLRFDVDNTPNPSGEDDYTICWTYTVDAQ